MADSEIDAPVSARVTRLDEVFDRMLKYSLKVPKKKELKEMFPTLTQENESQIRSTILTSLLNMRSQAKVIIKKFFFFFNNCNILWIFVDFLVKRDKQTGL